MTARLASQRDLLRRLIEAGNATTNPPSAAGGEPDGARSPSHGVLRVPSGDGFSTDRVKEFMKQARAL